MGWRCAPRGAVPLRARPPRRSARGHSHAFTGDLHADGYAGFDRLYCAKIAEVACWAHVRRKFFDVHAATGSATAREALDHIAGLYAIEDDARGRSPYQRRCERQTRAGLLLSAFRSWLDATQPKLSRRFALAVAIRYALARWPALVRYVSDGHLEIDNNAAERALRGVAIGRKNWLFAGSDEGGHRAAAVLSLIETDKLNKVDPQAWLADTIARIADHPARRIDQLLPWHCGSA